jgi:TPR repeat protein
MSQARCDELLEKMQKGDDVARTELITLAHDDVPNPYALNTLAICYDQGIMVAKSNITAASYYRKAIKHGHAAASYNLAFSYLKNEPDEAASLFFNAAKLNFTHAINELKQLANRNNKKAITYLGACYENNHCVPGDITTAISYYNQAANLGDDAALCHLARLKPEKRNRKS